MFLMFFFLNLQINVFNIYVCVQPASGRQASRSSHRLCATTATTTQTTPRRGRTSRSRAGTAPVRPRRQRLATARRQTVDAGFLAVRWTAATNASYDWQNATPMSASFAETTTDVSIYTNSTFLFTINRRSCLFVFIFFGSGKGPWAPRTLFLFLLFLLSYLRKFPNALSIRNRS